MYVWWEAKVTAQNRGRSTGGHQWRTYVLSRMKRTDNNDDDDDNDDGYVVIDGRWSNGKVGLDKRLNRIQTFTSWKQTIGSILEVKWYPMLNDQQISGK